MTSRIRFITYGAVLLQALLASPAHAFVADLAKGEAIAKHRCATCHLVSPVRRRPLRTCRVSLQSPARES
jgi:mono/diheme cytochrome c family protein